MTEVPALFMATGKHTVAADGKPGPLPLGYLWVEIDGRATLMARAALGATPRLCRVIFRFSPRA